MEHNNIKIDPCCSKCGFQSRDLDVIWQLVGNERFGAQPTTTGSECKKIPRLLVYISQSEKYCPVSQYLPTSYV